MLQTVANDLNILEIPYRMQLEKQMWNKEFPLIRDSSKCIKCMRCIQVCDKVQSLHIWDVEGTGSRTTVNVSGHKTIEESACSLCGQCVTHCPVGALRERNDTEKVWEALSDPNKIVVTQVAPAVRTAWGEELGCSQMRRRVGMILDALKKMGADYVFDTCFSADLTIMEEATEFIQRFNLRRIKGASNVDFVVGPGMGFRFAKSQFPHMVKYLSSAKSPQQMFGTVMKTYLRKTGRKSGADFHSLDHAVSGKKRRAGDGVVPRRICR